MAINLFSKENDKKCAHCVFATIIEIDERILCPNRGFVYSDDRCQKYKYDALKRIPKKQPVLPTYSEDDFKL
jgi:hypothetical protein